MHDLELITKLEDIPLHDSRIGDLKIDYDKQKIFLYCTLDIGKEIPISVCFESVIYSDISFYSPWGESYYIYEANEYKNSDFFYRLNEFSQDKSVYNHYEFILNSGDNINIIAKSFSCKRL